MRVAIYGAGSLGTVLGAYITKAGTPIDLISRNVAHISALNKNGAQIEGSVNLIVPVTAMLPNEMTGQYDIIFLMTKQQENIQVIKFLKTFLPDDGALCTFQNGFPEPQIAQELGKKRVLGCAVQWGAELVSPGVVKLTSEPYSLSFSLGGLDELNFEKLNQVKILLQKMCPVIFEKNFIGSRWSKLLINSAFSGLSVVLGANFGEILDNKKSRLCSQYVMKECFDTAKFNSVKFEPVQGKDIEKILNFEGPLKQKISFFILPFAMKKHRQIRASMLQDIENGKQTEIDSINGVVCEYGRGKNVKTPFNDKIVEIVHQIEEKKLKPSFENLRLFDDLLSKTPNNFSWIWIILIVVVPLILAKLFHFY